MTIENSRDRDTVRELARNVVELADSPENERRRQLWCDVNSLRKPWRPPVICHPGSGAWEELLPRSALTCTQPYWADLEYHFRKILYKWEIGDDTVVDPWMSVATVMNLEGEHLWGLPVRHIRPDIDTGGVSTRAAWSYDPPIREEADIERIVPPSYRHDPEATQVDLARMQDALGDIFQVREICALPGPGAWLHGWATQLRGVEQLLLDLMTRPEWVHRLMRILMEGFLGVMDQYENANVLTCNNVGLMSCDNLPQSDSDPDHIRLKDLWGRGESQEFQGVSPTHYEEFLLHYQKPILERFGLTFYGCCEDLTNKIDMVLSIPNLRKFVCSAWTDIGKLAEAVGDRYAIEWRQKATDVVYASDLSQVEQHIETGLRLTQDCPIMIVLQELETVNGNLRRLTEWATIAKEVGTRCSA